MKAYPSIPHATGQSFRNFDAWVFDKLDGSNLRWEWTRKAGWNKFGTRHRLFDETDEVFGGAVDIFMDQMAEPLEEVALKQRWQRCIAYTEFWGLESFAGVHVPEDPKHLTLIDMDVYKQGILEPHQFLRLFEGAVETAEFLGCVNWTRGFVQKVRDGEVPVTFEGVVGKLMLKRKLILAKAKTQDWIDRVQERYVREEAAKIIAS